MAIKLKEIAEYLNISVSTVSRVLTNKDRVDAGTRKKVLDALEKFQYRPYEVARSLKSKTTKAIGLIVPDISNSFFSMVIKGVEGVARVNGYHVILCNSDVPSGRLQDHRACNAGGHKKHPARRYGMPDGRGRPKGHL